MCNVIRYQPTECSSLFVFSSSSRTRASFLCFPSLPRVALLRQTHAPLPVGKDQFGNRYFEQLDWEKEIPGRHRWVDYSQVSWTGIRPVAIRFGDTDRQRDPTRWTGQTKDWWEVPRDLDTAYQPLTADVTYFQSLCTSRTFTTKY